MLAIAFVCGCTQTRNARPSPDPIAVLQAIPPSDPAQYERIADTKKWRNPYLIVRPDGVALYDSADNAEIILKPDEVIAALARLPEANWPYGRVVAVEAVGRATEEGAVAIRRNQGIVGGMLQGAHISVRWVPEN